MARHWYIKVWVPGHPLVRPDDPEPVLPEHRVVLYDKIGPGPHPCHWCGKILEWKIKTSVRKGILSGSIVADHVDGNDRNNSPDNIVPSCHSCNTKRGYNYRFNVTPYVMKPGGRNAATEHTCQNCGTKFLTTKTGGSKYCSVKCKGEGRTKETHGVRCCVQCGVNFSFRTSRRWRLNGNHGVFCSPDCHRNYGRDSAGRFPKVAARYVEPGFDVELCRLPLGQLHVLP